MFKFIDRYLNPPTSLIGKSAQEISALNTLAEEKKSPFAQYTGETHSVMAMDTTTSCSEAEWLVGQGIITKNDKAVLSLINKLIFSTSLQIHTFLALEGVHLELDEVKQILFRLKKKSFVTAIEFHSPTGKSAFKVYCLGYHGTNLIKAQGQKLLGQIRFINEKPSSDIKRHLASNQLISKLMIHYGGTFQNNVPLQYNRTFLWTNLFTDRSNTPYFVEAVRRNTEWQQQIKEKSSRYASIMDHYAYLDSPLSTNPTLLLTAEDPQHMLELHTVIATTKLRKKDVLYSCDGLIYRDVNRAFFK